MTHVGKGTVRFVILYAIQTLTTKAFGETFKIQSKIRNCNSQKIVYLLKCRICGEAPYVSKAKTVFDYFVFSFSRVTLCDHP